MTPSQLKARYEYHNPDGHFFDKKTMAFFGDTMSNFGCYQDNGFYVLYRKKPVKHGLTGSFLFDCNNFDYMGAKK